MIGLEALTATEWAQAQSWRTDPWALPRSHESDQVQPLPEGDGPDRWYALKDSATLVGVGGLIDIGELPPGLARLSLFVGPAVRQRWERHLSLVSMVSPPLALPVVAALVVEGFRSLGLTRIIGECARDVPAVVEHWQWLTHWVLRQHPDVVHTGEWAYDGKDVALPMRWHWLRR